MTWLVAFQYAMGQWAETDDEKRLALTLWFKSLAVDGPPLFYEMDDTQRYYRTVAPTGNVVEYLVGVHEGVIGILRIR